MITFFFRGKTVQIYSLGNFQVYNTVLLTIILMLYIRSPEIIHLITGSLYPLTNISPSPCPTPVPCNHHSTLSLALLESACGFLLWHCKQTETRGKLTQFCKEYLENVYYFIPSWIQRQELLKPDNCSYYKSQFFKLPSLWPSIPLPPAYSHPTVSSGETMRD